jgi:hypothetical protein
MNILDNTQENPDHKGCNCKTRNCPLDGYYNCKADNCNCGGGCNCGENCTCNKDFKEIFISAETSNTPELSTFNEDCDFKRKKNTCTLFTLSKVIIIDLDEE